MAVAVRGESLQKEEGHEGSQESLPAHNYVVASVDAPNQCLMDQAATSAAVAMRLVPELELVCSHAGRGPPRFVLDSAQQDQRPRARQFLSDSMSGIFGPRFTTIYITDGRAMPLESCCTSCLNISPSAKVAAPPPDAGDDGDDGDDGYGDASDSAGDADTEADGASETTLLPGLAQ